MVYICRLCLKSVDKESKVFPVSGVDNNGVAVTTLVKTLVPEIYLGLSENPVLCFSCHDALVDAYSFRLQCLRSENLIGIFMRETHNTTPLVELQRVVNYWKNVYKTNRRDISVAKSNLSEWFGLDDDCCEEALEARETLVNPPRKRKPSNREGLPFNVRINEHPYTELSDVTKLTSDKVQIAEVEPHRLTEEATDGIETNTEDGTHKSSDSELKVQPEVIVLSNVRYGQEDESTTEKQCTITKQPKNLLTIDQEVKECNVRNKFSDKEISDVIKSTSDEAEIREAESHGLSDEQSDLMGINTEGKTHEGSDSDILEIRSKDLCDNDFVYEPQTDDFALQKERKRTLEIPQKHQNLGGKGKGNQYDVKINECPDKEISNILPLIPKESDGITETENLCDCPTFYDCPSSIHFDLVPKNLRAGKLKKHINCTLDCDLRHRKSCKYYKDNLSKKDKEGPCEEGAEMVIGTVESANSTCDENDVQTTEDESVDDEIDMDSLLQQLQKNENLEKLGLLENTTNLQDSYVIKRFINKKDNSFHYALIPKAVGQNSSAVEKSSLNEILVTAEKDSDNDEHEIEETNLQVIDSIQKDTTKDTTASNENVKSVAIEDTNDHILPKIKEEPADEEMLKEIPIEVPIEDTSMTMSNTEPVVEKDPLDITVNQPEDKPMPFIRVKPVESLKETCNLNDESLPVADSLNPVKPGPLTSTVPSISVSEPVPTHPTFVDINETDVLPPELSPNIDIRPDVQDPDDEGSYIGPRLLFTKNSPPPLQLCVQKLPKPNLNSRSLLKSKSSIPLMTPTTNVSNAEEPSELNHSKELPSFPVNIEMPVLSPMNAEEQIEIKEEPLGYNEEDELEYFDKELSASTSETNFTETSNLSKLIADPPLTEDQFDVPEYVQIKNVSFLNITKLVHEVKQPKEKKQNEPKVAGNSSSIRLPQSLSELLDADPNKSEPENDDLPEPLVKSVDDDPTYDADRDPLYMPPRGFSRRKRSGKHFDETEVAEEPAKKMRRSTRNKTKKKIVEPDMIPIKKAPPPIIINRTKCVLRTSFTRDGYYVNDHDYFISPYARNKMVSYRRKGGESCICLLCDLIHSTSKHVEHMRVHNTKCNICRVDFENVFILNMHVRKHTSHCRECIASVTYWRYLHHAQIHNSTTGMSKIPLPQPPKLPIMESDFLDDLEPKVNKDRRKKLKSKENGRRRGRPNRGKKSEPIKIPDNKFSKPSSITLTELLKSSRPSDIKGLNTGALNESFSKSNKLAKRKSYSGKRNKVSKSAKIDNKQKDSNKSKKCKAAEQLSGASKRPRKERSEIIESHVYAKDGSASSSKKNEMLEVALGPKKDEQAKDCHENKTAPSLLKDPFKPDQSAIGKILHTDREKSSISLTDDVAQKIAPVGSDPLKSPSTKPSKPLTIRMENLEKVDDTFMKKNLVLVKANTLKSHIKRELQLDAETGFKLPNKILWKRRLCSKQPQPGAPDNSQQKCGTECVAVCTETTQTEEKAKDSGAIESANFVEMPSMEQSVPDEKLARITESPESNARSPKLDLVKRTTVLKSTSIDPQHHPNCSSPPVSSFSADTSSANQTTNHPFGIEPECSKTVATVELPKTEEKPENIRAYAKCNQISATSTSSLASEGIMSSSCPNLKTPPPVIRVSAEKNTLEDPLALEPDNLGVPPIMDQIVSKEKVAKIKAYLRSNMKASNMNRASTAGTVKITDADAQRGFKMFEKVPPHSAPTEINAKESESVDKEKKEITKIRVYRKSIDKPASLDICESPNSSDLAAFAEIDPLVSAKQGTKSCSSILLPSHSQDVDKM